MLQISRSNTFDIKMLSPSKPQNGLVSFFGQDSIKEKLRFEIDLALKQRTALNHMLICGGDGEGKEKLAYCLASEAQTNIRVADGYSIERPGDLAAIVTNLRSGDIFALRDIERLNQSVADILVCAMRDFTLDLITGKGPSARSIRLKLPRFTIFGTTSRLANVREMLRDQFRVMADLEPYDDFTLARIIHQISLERSLDLQPSGAAAIAKKANGSLKSAVRILDQVRDFAIVNNLSSITDQVVLGTLGIFTIALSPEKDTSGRSFELKCMNLLQRIGLEVKLTGRTADGGIDLIARSNSPIAGGTYVVQCKDWSSPVGAPIVRDLYGVIHSLDADRGILITSGTFTSEALRFASGKRLELIDGERLNFIISHIENQ